MIMYLADRPAQTIAHAAILREMLQIKLSITPKNSILTPGQPVPALTLAVMPGAWKGSHWSADL